MRTGRSGSMYATGRRMQRSTGKSIAARSTGRRSAMLARGVSGTGHVISEFSADDYIDLVMPKVVAWYRPEASALVFNGDGSDGDPVSREDDLSGNGNHRTQDAILNQPTWHADGGLNGHPFLAFDRDLEQYMETSALSGYPADKHINVLLIARVPFSETLTAGHRIMAVVGTATQTLACSLRHTAVNRVSADTNDTAAIAHYLDASVDDDWHYLRYQNRASDDATVIWFDGVERANSGAVAPSGDALSLSRIGAAADALSRATTIDVVDEIHFEDLTAQEQTHLHTYLNLRYGTAYP